MGCGHLCQRSLRVGVQVAEPVLGREPVWALPFGKAAPILDSLLVTSGRRLGRAPPLWTDCRVMYRSWTRRSLAIVFAFWFALAGETGLGASCPVHGVPQASGIAASGGDGHAASHTGLHPAPDTRGARGDTGEDAGVPHGQDGKSCCLCIGECTPAAGAPSGAVEIIIALYIAKVESPLPAIPEQVVSRAVPHSLPFPLGPPQQA
jgi:hypothetical protein